MKKLLLFILFALTCSLTYGQSSYGDDSADNMTVVEQVKIANNLQVFPNPAIDYISLNNVEGVKKIAVFNLIGNEVTSFNVVAGEKYYVGDLRVGMYLIQIVGTNNKTLTTLRLSKK